jgi:hypothetical protein
VQLEQRHEPSDERHGQSGIRGSRSGLSSRRPGAGLAEAPERIEEGVQPRRHEGRARRREQPLHLRAGSRGEGGSRPTASSSVHLPTLRPIQRSLSLLLQLRLE